MPRKIAAALVAACFSASTYAARPAAVAASAPEALARAFAEFHERSRGGILLCRAHEYAAEVAAEAHEPPPEDGDFHRCIQTEKDAAKANLNALLGSVRKPSLNLALKQYALAVFASLSGIEPVMDEGRGDYQRRQREAAGKLDAAWNAVELES